MNNISLQQRFSVIRSNKAFELFVVAIIIGSALLVGAKTYDLHPLAMQAVTLLDYLVTLVFLTEITIRFLGEEKKSQFFKNAWNVFDTLIVLISLIPVDNSDMALVARLVRIFRVLRMVSTIKELRMLLSSIFKAMPQLGYVLILMFIIFYIYAAMGSLLFEKINPVLWGDVSISMLTLFRVMTFEDWTDVMYETMAVYPLSWLFYMTFIFFTAFAFLNMLIGIVVNVMDEENQKALKQEAQDANEPSIKDIYLKLEALEARLSPAPETPVSRD
jgi:voltage-gated sodium channel